MSEGNTKAYPCWRNVVPGNCFSASNERTSLALHLPLPPSLASPSYSLLLLPRYSSILSPTSPLPPLNGRPSHDLHDRLGEEEREIEKGNN
ncbi:hypothetical protein E2C01_023994 [Portunus trituberculatus]|uniref:Uncharacterized protein n=1 Tax=Portunus trituberculatus TaxID=210409 RepID=A0A5B7ED76_PORTR|nr:hypothetical protein [Portunus trituberculatus]